MKTRWVLALLSTALPAFAQYAGPAILARGEAPAAMAAQDIRFRPFVEVAGIYDSGLAGVSIDPSGTLANSVSAGVNLTWGISGSKDWQHTKSRAGLSWRNQPLRAPDVLRFHRAEPDAGGHAPHHPARFHQPAGGRGDLLAEPGTAGIAAVRALRPFHHLYPDHRLFRQPDLLPEHPARPGDPEDRAAFLSIWAATTSSCGAVRRPFMEPPASARGETCNTG